MSGEMNSGEISGDEMNSCKMSNSEIKPLDSVVTSIIEKFQERARFGKQKYGTDLDRKDLSILDWIQHSQEELMDGILYLEKLKKEILEKK